MSIEKELNLAVNKIFEDVTRKWQPEAMRLLKQEIKSFLEDGVSPVKGFGRFKSYSPTYTNQIMAGKYKEYGKRVRPVNLNLSGDMIDSLYTRSDKLGEIIVGFTDELADIHNRQGAGKSKVKRRLLPHENEEFSRVITEKLLELFDKLAK